MLALLKLIQSLIKTLHSAGTPGQVAAGMALGSALGLTPLLSLHNLVIFSVLVLLNATMLAIAKPTPAPTSEVTMIACAVPAVMPVYVDFGIVSST